MRPATDIRFHTKEKKRGYAPAFFISLCLLPPLFFAGKGALFLFSGLLFLLSAVSLPALKHKESIRIRPRHFFGLLVSVFLFLLTLLAVRLTRLEGMLPRWCGAFLSHYLLYLCSVFFGILLAAWYAISHPPKREADCLIILGCALSNKELTPILKARADCALSWYRDQLRQGRTPPLLIPSGGQGPDESTSEAAAIRDYLLQNKVPDEHIRIEDRSRNTKENMEFSLHIAKACFPHPRCLFATTNYHLFRSSLFARRVGMSGCGIGAPTKWYYWAGAFAREFIGILSATWPIHAAAAVLLCIIL